jgi:hypothetical protein
MTKSNASEFLFDCGVVLKQGSYVIIQFKTHFPHPPRVVVSSHWKNQNSSVGHVDTIDEITSTSCRVVSGNEAPNYYVEWMAMLRL